MASSDHSPLDYSSLDHSPLDHSLTHASPRRAPGSPPAASGERERDEAWGGVDTAWRVMSEFLTATFFWGGVGWLCDRWLGTAPWLMVLGFVVGNATGLYLLYLRSEPEPRERDSRT